MGGGKKRRQRRAPQASSSSVASNVEVELRKDQLLSAVDELASDQALPSVVPKLYDAIQRRTAEAVAAVLRVREQRQLALRPVMDETQRSHPNLFKYFHAWLAMHEKEAKTYAEVVDENILTIVHAIYDLERSNSARNEVAMHTWQEATNSMIDAQNKRIAEVTIFWKSEIVRLTQEVQQLQREVRELRASRDPRAVGSGMEHAVHSQARGRSVGLLPTTERELSRERMMTHIRSYNRSHSHDDLRAAVSEAQQIAMLTHSERSVRVPLTLPEHLPASISPSSGLL
jgi:hypothetical protein